MPDVNNFNVASNWEQVACPDHQVVNIDEDTEDHLPHLTS